MVMAFRQERARSGCQLLARLRDLSELEGEQPTIAKPRLFPRVPPIVR
jgi:hypothetical protein